MSGPTRLARLLLSVPHERAPHLLHRLVPRVALAASLLLALPSRALAADGLDTGDTAWILASTGLVLFMTIPGLALFYGGLVRTKNVLSVLMQCLALTGLMTLLWLVVGSAITAFASVLVAWVTG